MFDPIWAIVADQGSPDDPENYTAGWSVLLDPDECPTQYLPYSSQFNGTGIQPGTDDATARALIKNEAGFARGTLQAVQAAIERAQSTPDSTRYAVVERVGPLGPDAYHFLVLIDLDTLTTQGDPTTLIANVTATKPAGVQFTVVPFSAPLVSEYTRLFSAITVELGSATIADVT